MINYVSQGFDTHEHATDYKIGQILFLNNYNRSKRYQLKLALFAPTKQYISQYAIYK